MSINFVVCKPSIGLHKTKSIQCCCFNYVIHETITIILNLKVFVVVVGFSSSCWMMEQTCSLSIHLILIQYISSNECSSVVYGACLLPFETCQVP